MKRRSFIKNTTLTIGALAFLSKETLASLKVNQPQVDDNKKMVETVRTATRKAAAITAKTTEVKKNLFCVCNDN